MREDGSEMVGANSAIIYDPDGNYVGGYRKINMFETDKTWARPGSNGFFLFHSVIINFYGINR